jgi:CheY-like chemotaxis protein
MTAVAYFEDAGFDVLEAKDGDEAIQMLDGMTELDILVTDVRMPGRNDGVQVAHHARLRFPTAFILVVTGFAADIEERLKLFDPRICFLAKPYRLATLVSLVQSASGSLN